MPGPERSLGCYRCRSMKLKCDQEHPDCRRCQRVNVKCPGYRHENDLIFVDVSNKVREREAVARPKHSRKNTRERPGKLVGNPNKQKTKIIESSQFGSSSLCKPSFNTDWKRLALCRFMTGFTMDTDHLNINPGFLHNLPRVYQEAAGDDPLLDKAVMTVALVHASNHFGSDEFAIQARKSYGVSISLLNKALSDGDLKSDTTLLAILFLNYYQIFSDEKPTSDVLNTHSDALSLLLRLRGTASQFIDPRTGGITRAAFYIIAYRNITRRIAPGPEAALMEQSMESYKETPWAQFTFASSRITRLLPRCDKILKQTSTAGQASLDLLEIIRLVQHEDSRYPERYSGISIDRDHLKSSFLEVTFINSYRGGRIVLLETLIELTLQVQHHPDLQSHVYEMEQLRSQAERSIHKMAEEISLTTRDLLIEFDAKRKLPWKDAEPITYLSIAYFLSVAPLGVALSAKRLSDEQRRIMAGQLTCISSKIGIRRPLRDQCRR